MKLYTLICISDIEYRWKGNFIGNVIVKHRHTFKPEILGQNLEESKQQIFQHSIEAYFVQHCL